MTTDISEGVRCKDISEGVRCKDISEGVRCKDISEGVRCKDIPEEITKCLDEETLDILHSLYNPSRKSYMIYDMYETKSNLLKEFVIKGFYDLIQHLHSTNIIKWNQFMDTYDWVYKYLVVNDYLNPQIIQLMFKLYKNCKFSSVNEKKRMKEVLKKCQDFSTYDKWINVRQERKSSKGAVIIHKYKMKRGRNGEITIGKITMIPIGKNYCKYVQA
jgi:hypothetical protein